MPHKTLVGRTSFAWGEGGGFLILRAEVYEPGFPDGICIIGSDDGADTVGMLYFDERGTSRRFEVTVAEGRMAWRRDDPKLAQDYALRAEGKDKLISTGRISKDGGAWADDLSQVYLWIG